MPDRLHVLLAEDSESDASQIEATLRKRWPELALERVATTQEFHLALDRCEWDLVLADPEIPDFSMHQILGRLRQVGRDLLFIAVSGSNELAASLIQEGAHDFVHKDDLARLIAVVGSKLVPRTDRKLRRESDVLLATSEERYRRLFETSHDGILIIDVASGAIIDVNLSLVSLLGYPATSYLGRQLSDADPFVSVEDFKALFEETRQNGYARRYSLPLQTTDGRDIHVAFVSTLYWEKDDAFIQCSLRDISGRKRLEDSLTRANQTLRTLSRTNESLVHAKSEERLLQEVCQIIVEVGGFELAWVGYQEGDEAANIVLKSCHGRDKRDIEAFAKSLKNKSRVRHPAETSLCTGKAVVVADTLSEPLYPPWYAKSRQQSFRSVVAYPLCKGGVPFGALTIYDTSPNVWDIDTLALLGELSNDLAYGILALRERWGRYLAEMKLRESEEQFRTIATSARDAVIMIDNMGLAVFWNEAATRIFGYSAKEMLGQNVHHMIAPVKYHELYNKQFEIFRHTGEGPAIGKVLELIGRNMDGREFPIEISLSAVKIREQWAAIAIIRDITERKQNEERLHQADKMDALGNLAGGIAHDLKNMLFPILSLSSLTLKELPEGGRQRQRLEKVVFAAGRAKELLDKIHAFSHQDAAMRETVDISLLMIEAMDLIRPAVPSTITLHEEFHCPSECKITVDRGQFDAVLMNLSSNAIDAMEGRQGSLTIILSSVQISQEQLVVIPVPSVGRYLKLSVADTGSGMDEMTRQRIFDPWFSTKSKGKGTGLGLAVVKKVITEHGGAITVASEKGQGTRFDIFLPLAEPDGGFF